MPRLLAADVETAGLHRFQHITIAHPGAVQRQAMAGQQPLKPQVGHHRRHQPATAQTAGFGGAQRDQRHDLVTIDDLALFIDNDQPVGIAIERNADIGAAFQHLHLQRLGVRRTDIVVDVEAVGRHPDRNNLGAQLPQRFGRHLVRRAVGAIDDDLQAIEPQMIGKRCLGEMDIPPLGIIDPLGPADGPWLGQHHIGLDHGFDLGFIGIGQFVAIRAEQLDAIVMIGVMAGRNHHAQIGTHRPGEHSHRRGRHRPQLDDIHPHRGEPRGQRRFHHITRKPRVLADNNTVLVRPAQEMPARRLAHRHRDGRRHRRGVGQAANAIGAEIFARHAAWFQKIRLSSLLTRARLACRSPRPKWTKGSLAMQTRKSGTKGLVVSALGVGCMGMASTAGAAAMYGVVDIDEANATIRRAKALASFGFR